MPLRDRHILVVDDDQRTAAELELTLKLAGAQTLWISPAPQRPTALLYAGHAIDAAVLDVCSLGLTQAEAMASALADRGVPYLLVGYAGEDLPDRPAFVGRPVLKTPIAGRRLISTLEALLPARLQQGG